MPSHDNSTLEIIQVKYGERRSRFSDAFPNFASYDHPDRHILLDYSFWVMQDYEQTLLLDTGYDISQRNWLDEVTTVSPPDALAALGIDPLSVSTVIASHFHYDHIGFLYLFRNAQVIAAQAEYDHWAAQHRSQGQLDDHFVTAEDLEEVYRAKAEGRLTLVPDGPNEVVPGVTVYPVGGHSPGQLITVVHAATGSVLLTSDAAHLYEQIRYGWPFFAYADLEQLKTAYTVIHDLAERTGAVTVPGHDSRVRDVYPPYPGSAGEFATTLTPVGDRSDQTGRGPQ